MAMIVGVSIDHMTNQLVHRAIVHLANIYSGRQTVLQCFCESIEPLLDIFYQQITRLARVAQQCYQVHVINLHMNS